MNKEINSICSDLDIPKRIFKVKDIINNKNYIFVGSYRGIDSILNKINKSGTKSLTKNEETKLKEKYDYTNLEKMIDSNSILIKDFINIDDTILTIKKKIMTYINDKSLPNKQYLWVNTNRSNTERDDDGGEILGFEYNNNKNTLALKTDLTKDIASIELTKDPSYNLLDKMNVLLEEYGDNEIYNNINYIDYDSYIDRYSKDIKDKNEAITNIYFPFIRRSDLVFDNYTEIIKKQMEFNNKYENDFMNAKDKSIFNSCSIKNIVFEISQNDLNIDKIFRILKTSNNEPFIKLKNKDKDEFYKIFTKNYNTNINREVTKDFTNPNEYIINYDREKYKSVVPKKFFLRWVKKEITLKEKFLLKIKKEMESEFEHKTNNEILIKYLFKGKYYDINILANKLIVRDLNNEYNDIDIYYKLLSKIRKFLMKINNSIEDNKLLLGTNKNWYKDWKIITLDHVDNIKTKTKISLINNNISDYSNFIYKITNENSNVLHLKYKKVSNFESFENIKRFFIKLKNSKKSLSVNNFKDEWIKTCINFFNLSELDSLSLLTKFTEVIDAEELKKKPMEIDIDVILTQNYRGDQGMYTYKIEVNNCDNLLHLNRIKKLIIVLLNPSRSSLKKPAIKDSREDEFLLEISNTKITNNDDFDFGLDNDLIDTDIENDNNLGNDFVDLEDPSLEDLGDNQVAKDPVNDNDNNNETNDNNVDNDNDNNENSPMNSIKIGTYMSDMRKKRDNKLFKDDVNKNYTRQCGAVSMRQPIIITKEELINFEKKNPEAYNSIKKIEWGSSKSSKNFYMCPRIWCVRDKIVLTDEQLIENKKSPSGTCPFCKGEIVTDGKIEGNKTVIIRRKGTNKHWANPKTTDPLKKTSEWKKYLKDTEMDAYPSFLSPEKNPNGYCMPCCNKKPLSNYGICMDINIDYLSDVVKVPINAFKIGYKVDDDLLKKNDTILLQNTNKIIKITEEGNIPLEYLGKLELEPQEGMVITITKGKNKDKKYEIKKNKDKLIFDRLKEKTIGQHISGEDKFPLLKDKLGYLNEILELHLNSGLFKDKSPSHIDKQRLLRLGITQREEISFLEAIASLLDKDHKYIIKNIIKNLTPLDFLGLNNGDVYKMFGSVEDIYLKSDEEIESFLEWCKIYNIEDIEKSILNFLVEINESKDKDNLLKIIQDELGKQTSIINIKNRIIKKIELLEESNSPYTNYTFLILLYKSFENFKKYCGDLNIRKDPLLFIDLLSRSNEWLFKDGINIIILETKDKKLYINYPITNEIKHIYDKTKPICIIYKNRSKNHYLYEPIVFYELKDRKIKNIKFFSKDNIKDNIYKKIETLIDRVISKYNSEIDSSSLKSIYDYDEDDKKVILLDSTFKGVGFLTKENLIMFTKEFGISNKLIKPIKKISDITFENYTTIISKIDKIEKRPISLIVNNDNIKGILLEDGLIHPVKEEKYDSTIHTLPIENLTYVRNLLNNDKLEDNREKFIKAYDNELILYNQFLLNINDFFNSRTKHFDDNNNNSNINNSNSNSSNSNSSNSNSSNSNKALVNDDSEKIKILKDHIYTILDNPVFDTLYKTQKLKNIFIQILDNISEIDETPKNFTKTKKCGSLTSVKCKSHKLCKYKKQDKEIEIKTDKIFKLHFSDCKFVINTNYKNKFTNKLIEELINSYEFRLKVLETKLNISINEINTNIIPHTLYLEHINKIFDKKNLYIKNPKTKTLLNSSTLPLLVEYDLTILYSDLSSENNTKSRSSMMNNNNLTYNKKGEKFNSKGIIIDDSKIKEGKCIFPFKQNVYSDEPNYNCIKNKDDENICATDINRQGIMTKYGFCHENQCDSDIIASVFDKNGDDKSKEKNVKAGRCCFPFKERKKPKGESDKIIEHNECVKSKKKRGKGDWCATSVYDGNTNKEKNEMKTYAYCPINISKKKLKINIKSNKTNNTTKKANNSSNNSTNNNNSINKTKKKSINTNSKISKKRNLKVVQGSNTIDTTIIPTETDIEATNIDKGGRKRKKVEGIDVKSGKCIFPFKNGNRYMEKSDGCVYGKTGDWCATKVNKDADYKVLSFGYCPSDKKENNNK